MDERTQRRMRLTRAVNKLLRYQSLRAALPPLREDGTAPMVVGLLDDTMRTIAEHVHAVGGAAHLVIPERLGGDDGLRVRILRVTEGAGNPGELGDDDCPVDENSTLAVLLDLLQVGGHLTCHVFDHETMVRFITDGVQPVPA